MDGTVEATEVGLQVSVIAHEYNSEYGEGYIFYQSYSQGSYVDPGTVIEIKVSKGAEAKTYKCNLDITAPTPEEAPDYVSGTPVQLKLVTDDDNVLLETTASSFPHAANYYGLSAAGGTLTMSYTVTIQGPPTTDENGNQVAGATTTEQRSFNRRVEFTEE